MRMNMQSDILAALTNMLAQSHLLGAQAFLSDNVLFQSIPLAPLSQL